MSGAPRKEIPPPKGDDDFEDLARALFSAVWKDPGAKLHGRPGQGQDGVDVYGEDRVGGTGLNGVQCKQHGSNTLVTDKALLKELREEVEKAKGFRPPLRRFLFATTARRSANLQQEARNVTEQHRKEGLFAVEVLGWEDIENLLREHPKVLAWYLDERSRDHTPRLEFGRLPIASRLLIGRETELARLDAAWEDPGTHVLTFVAFGGMGKSALVSHWLDRISADGWRGARRVLDWSFYSQGTEERVTSADRFLDHALTWFGDPDPRAGASRDRGLRLAELVRREETLLVLDGVEPLQHPPTSPLAGRLKDPGLAALLKGLAGANPGLCVVTTRERISDLDGFPKTAPQENLEALSPEAGAELLKQLGVKGKDSELLAASREFGNHALTLTLLGGYLSRACGGDVRRRKEVDLAGADQRKGGHALRVIARYAEWMGEGPELAALRLLGLFDRPADPKALAALRAKPAIPRLTGPLMDLGEEDWQLTLSNLREHGLLLPADPNQPGTLDAHPLVRVSFQEELEKQRPEAWRAGNLRLYEHLKKEAPPLPDTLEVMELLYTAVVHGCRVGRQQEAYREVYRRRIQRSSEFFSLKKLGAFGSELSVLSSFFDRPWDQPSANLTSGAQAFLLNEAGFCLRALGRLAEAVQPMEASLETATNRNDWKNAAIAASNLSELTLTLGEVERAVTFGKQSVDLADRSRDLFQEMVNRSTLAEALHQVGSWEESAEAFRMAEKLQAEQQPLNSLLFSLRGFQYCDLLLNLAEPPDGSVLDGLATHQGARPFRKAGREVRERAEKTLALAVRYLGLLNIALDHLSLGRAHLGLALTPPRAVARGKEAGADFARAAEHLDQAVEGLERAGVEHHLPRAYWPVPPCGDSGATFLLPKPTFPKRWRSPSGAPCACTSATRTWNGPGSAASGGTATVWNGTWRGRGGSWRRLGTGGGGGRWSGWNGSSGRASPPFPPL